MFVYALWLINSETGMTSQICYILEVKERKDHKTGIRASDI